MLRHLLCTGYMMISDSCKRLIDLKKNDERQEEVKQLRERVVRERERFFAISYCCMAWINMHI